MGCLKRLATRSPEFTREQKPKSNRTSDRLGFWKHFCLLLDFDESRLLCANNVVFCYSWMALNCVYAWSGVCELGRLLLLHELMLSESLGSGKDEDHATMIGWLHKNKTSVHTVLNECSIAIWLWLLLKLELSPWRPALNTSGYFHIKKLRRDAAEPSVASSLRKSRSPRSFALDR